MDYKVLQTPEIKMLDEGSGSFTGYASVFGNYDRVQEAVAQNAFTNIDAFVKQGFGAIGHDWSGLPIATIAEARQDKIGLWIKADFHSTKEAQDARTVINERIVRGKFVGLSIGYEVKDSEYTDSGRLLKSLELYEVSLVTIPANPLAGITGVKDASLAGLSFDEHSDAVLAACKDYVTRLTDLHSLRQKDGRTISAQKRDVLTQIKSLIDDALVLTVPKAKEEDVRNAYAKYLKTILLARQGENN